jgi:hypothetical protein
MIDTDADTDSDPVQEAEAVLCRGFLTTDP